MRFTVEYRRSGHQVASRMHTNSFHAAQEKYLAALCDTDCTDVILTDREAGE